MLLTHRSGCDLTLGQSVLFFSFQPVSRTKMSTANDFEDQVSPQQGLWEKFMAEEEQFGYECQALRTIIKGLEKSGSVRHDHWGPLPREQLLDLLEKTNYNNPDSRTKAVRKLTSSKDSYWQGGSSSYSRFT